MDIKSRLALLIAKARWRWHQNAALKDEFHYSLDMDPGILRHLNKEDEAEYLAELFKRRNAAHEKELNG